MKERINAHRKIALLALAGLTLLTMPLHAGIITNANGTLVGDLILGIRATGAPGQTLNLEVDLGVMSQFYNASPGSMFALPGLSVQDLVNTYGASWASRTDLWWGAVATAGRISGTPDGHAPVGTLWATAPDGSPAWDRRSVFSQNNASSTIETML